MCVPFTATIGNKTDPSIDALFRHGEDVFGRRELFEKWLDTENLHFGGKPKEWLDTVERIKYIDNHLTGIEYGDNA